MLLLSTSLMATGAGAPSTDASAPVRPSAVAAGGDTCATATVIATLPYNDSGNTTNATDTQPFFLNSACAGGGMVTRPGPDVVYSITVFPGNSLTFTLTPSATYDPTLYIVGGSCGSGSGCVVESDTGGEGQVETIGPRTFNPGTYYVYVDSIFSPEECPCDHGTYMLSVTGTLGVPNNTSFYTLTPCRILDTRDPNGPYGGPALAASSTRVFTIAGQCSVPATAKSVSVNVTVTQPTAPGHLILFPGGTPPSVSTINFRTGQTRANNAIVPLSATGTVSVTDGQSSGTTHFILDVNGYFQ